LPEIVITQTANTYVEIVVPDGQENFALIFDSANNSGGTLWDDAIAATINGGDISAYGLATINTFQATATENQITVVQYTGLPAGANTLRFTKSNTTKYFYLWGGCYWHGNSMILKNFAISGQNIYTLKEKLKSLVNDYNLYNWLVELPNMNTSSSSYSAEFQLQNDFYLLNTTELDLNNTVFYTTHPFGTDPTDGDPNYYLTLANPITFKQRSILDIVALAWSGCYFIDILQYFEKDIIARGGTLAGGEAGTYYTLDGEHLSDTGAGKFAGFLLPKIPTIPD